MPGAFCELTREEDRIAVFFPFDVGTKNAVKAINGSRFVPKDKAGPDGPHWTLPLDIRSARKLRDIFGKQLVLGDAVAAWGREQVMLERNLRGLHTADSAVLDRVPLVAPRIARVIAGEPMPEFNLPARNPLSRKRKPRPYQTADIKMMAMANVLNANQPGTGKTIEVLGATVEAELDKGVHLVCAPRTSLENVWRVEVERLLQANVYTAENPAERRKQVTAGLAAAARGETAWLLVIPDDLRVKKLAKHEDDIAKREAALEDPLYARKDHKGNVYGYANELHKRIVATKFNTFTIDEFHKHGLGNTLSLFTLGTDMIQAERHWRLSGTPMGGKPVRLFPVLRSIEPNKFSSKWKWADEWLTITDNGYGKVIGGIKDGKEDEFYEAHSRHMVRRLKRDALPGLPAKVPEEVLVPMTPKQKKQYAKFAKDAEVRIESAIGDGDRLVAGSCVLAEYSRLKQFANAYCELNDKGEVVPTEDSGKLPALLEKLDEQGVRKVDPEPGARAIIASQSKRMVYMVSKWLTKQGIANDTLTGDTKDSKPVINRFKDGTDAPYCIVMTTETGGVSLNLEEANSVHILDEDWNPDNDEQLEDRGDRGERTTPLVCVYYRTENSVQQYIAKVAEGKKVTNHNVLDLYRQMKEDHS
jgi:hypothetical protein